MTDKKKPSANSLANLRPIHTSEHARKMQAASVESRLANKARREALRDAADAFQKENIEVPSAYDTLQILLARAIQEDDHDEISRIASLLLPYEKPRLASQEVAMTNVVEDLSEAELIALLKEEDDDDAA